MGVHGGYGWDNDAVKFKGDPASVQPDIDAGNLPSSISTSANGYFGGGQAGYNWVAGSALFGIEADISYGKLNGGGTFTNPGNVKVDAEREVNWFGTVRARVGMLATPSLLLYATGGLAYGDTSMTFGITNLSGPTPAFVGAASSSGVKTGWTAGGGFEFMLTNNVTFKTEYLYVDLGTQTATFNDPSGSGDYLRGTADFQVHTVRGGLNVRF